MVKERKIELKEGAFTKQAKARNLSLNKYADLVVKNYKDNKSGKKVSYVPDLTTYRRAIFYNNFARK
tara:strand:- start:7068 stop:7268 length:201 start_codon:yes stop_codon:yes gene_type:complete